MSRDEATGGVVATASVAGGQEVFRASRLLVAMGRRPVTDGLNLDAVGVKTGDVRARSWSTRRLASSNPRIWAAGDVTGHREFVYVAAAHGTLVVENAFTDAVAEVDYRHLPRVTFTSPALGAVGMTEKDAVAAGIRCDCRVLPLEYVPAGPGQPRHPRLHQGRRRRRHRHGSWASPPSPRTPGNSPPPASTSSRPA